MGQKANPISNRLGIIRGWDSNWFGGKDYAEKTDWPSWGFPSIQWGMVCIVAISLLGHGGRGLEVRVALTRRVSRCSGR